MSDKLEVQKHALPVRLSHWAMALAMLIMIGSGWRIYDSTPIFGFLWFPYEITLGGDVFIALARNNDPGVAGAIAWHFAGMWLLVLAYAVFVSWGVITGHFRRDFLPVGPRSFMRDFIAAATFKLPHKLGEYNAVQKVAYWVALAAVALMLISGAAIWKPVQTYPLELLFGGFQGARLVHFLGMSVIVGFLLVHIALVVLVPKTLVAMIVGRVTSKPHAAPQESV
jgi:thiosulfate reductase cytochrome b subunit